MKAIGGENQEERRIEIAITKFASFVSTSHRSRRRPRLDFGSQ